MHIKEASEDLRIGRAGSSAVGRTDSYKEKVVGSYLVDKVGS